MKAVEIVLFLLFSGLLVGCASQPEATNTPAPRPEAPTESAPVPEAPTPIPEATSESPAAPLTDLSALVGIWRGRPAGGLLQIDENHQTIFAQTMADLEGTSIGPTMYRGLLSLDGDTLVFEDARCDEGPGLYRIFLSAEGTLNFVSLEDACRYRLNNLMGQREEPQIDISWHRVTTELPAPGTGALELVRTIELPFIPHDISVAADGSIYAVEQGAQKVHKLDAVGNTLASWGAAGVAAGQFAFDPPPDGPPLEGGFLAVGAGGNVYISDSYNNRVQVFDPAGAFVAMWETYGDEKTPFSNPGPISADAQGNIYVADFGGAHQFTEDGSYVQTLQAAGEIAFDSQGNLYTVVLFENIAMKVPVSGGEPIVWGGEGTEDGLFTDPLWLVVGRNDTVIISDHSGRVQQFDSEGKFMTAWSDPGNGDRALTAPSSISLDAQGNLFVASKDRTTVYVLNP